MLIELHHESVAIFYKFSIWYYGFVREQYLGMLFHPIFYEDNEWIHPCFVYKLICRIVLSCGTPVQIVYFLFPVNIYQEFIGGLLQV